MHLQTTRCMLILQGGFSRINANVIRFGNKPVFQKKRKNCIKLQNNSVESALAVRTNFQYAEVLNSSLGKQEEEKALFSSLNPYRLDPYPSLGCLLWQQKWF